MKFVQMGKCSLIIIAVFAFANAHACGVGDDTDLHPIHIKTETDNYAQFFGPALTVGLKVGGYEGRSNWPRFIASAAMSYGIMAGLTESLKHTVREIRPDGSSADSWPSGHTANSFVGATILHKEYGQTRSPWFSVAGYGVATATGMLRVLNNRHWAGDVLAGAGIGIMSTEAAYALSSMFFKDKGLLRSPLENEPLPPSFISVSMGMGIGHQSIRFANDDNLTISFYAAAVADAEGAYFFNNYVGIGGRLRVRMMSPRSLNSLVKTIDQIKKPYSLRVTDHLTELTPSAGIYFNMPLDSHFSLGMKGLVGYSVTQQMNVGAHAESSEMDENEGVDWNLLTLDAAGTPSLGTGISVAWRYKSNCSWKVFFDYDTAQKAFTMHTAPTGHAADDAPATESGTFEKTKQMHYFTAGASFTINF